MMADVAAVTGARCGGRRDAKLTRIDQEGVEIDKAVSTEWVRAGLAPVTQQRPVGRSRAQLYL